MKKPPRPSRTLQIILSNLLERALAKPGETVTTRLSNNLKIDMIVKGESVLLMVSRSSVWPGVVEWHTILRHWPYPVDVRPELVHLYGRHYLSASLPLGDRTAVPGK
jgi:hypothetical protein